MGYEGILFELRSAEGAYLRSLIELLETKSGQRVQAIEQIRSLSKTYPNIMDFAEQVIKLQNDAGVVVPSKETELSLPMGRSIYSGEKLENALNHLTKGMTMTVISKSGGQFTGQFEEYSAGRLRIRGSLRKSFLLDDIRAIDAPQL